MFKIYRQKGCQFECRLKYAAHLANCIPWDYPIPKGHEGMKICLSALNGTNSLKEFHNYMDDPTALENCLFDCLPDCEEVKYGFQVCIQENFPPIINVELTWYFRLILKI